MNEGNEKKRKSYGRKEDRKGRGGAIGPDGEFVEFPEYEGDKEPRENRQAFTLFCKVTRKEVKKSLSSHSRNNRDHVNSTLKDRWHALTDDEKHVWKAWETWDAKRYSYQSELYEQKKKSHSGVKKKAKIDSSPCVVLHKHHERQWSGMFDKLMEYKRVEGDTNVLQRCKDDPKLGRWAKQQRRNRKLGKITKHRIAKLDSLDFDWEPLKSGSSSDKKWHAHFENLKHYKEMHGHCLVPYINPKLGRWVARLRVLQREGSLQEEREQALNKLGFSWCVAETLWQEQYTNLKRYKEAHGDCLVPVKYEENQQLSNWVQEQRFTFKKGTLCQDRIASLGEIGFDWAPTKKILDSRWAIQYKKLRDFKEDHGHCIPPVGTSLHYWVESQRIRRYSAAKNCRRPMSQEEINRLDEIGFIWKHDGNQQWKMMYKRLKRYKLSHGDCLVPRRFEEDVSLGNWVLSQRSLKKKGQLSPNRQEKLDKTGFVWSVLESREDTNQTKNDEKWKIQYEKLCLYRDETGHCMVTTRSNLREWVRKQRCLLRKNLLRSDRKDLLDKVGFVWSVDHYSAEKSTHARRWEAMYDSLVQFRNETGHCKVSRNHENEDLANWVKRQRDLFSRNMLHPGRKAKLDEIDFFLEWDPGKSDSVGG